jgi:hypothetical protein
MAPSNAYGGFVAHSVESDTERSVSRDFDISWKKFIGYSDIKNHYQGPNNGKSNKKLNRGRTGDDFEPVAMQVGCATVEKLAVS